LLLSAAESWALRPCPGSYYQDTWKYHQGTLTDSVKGQVKYGLSEVVMCEFLEDHHPTPALVGTNAIERAEARMWNRRIEQKITENMYNGFRFGEGLDLFKERMRCMPEAADSLKVIAQDGLKWFDEQITGKQFICGDRLTIGDLVLYCCTDFAKGVGQPLDADLKNFSEWFARVEARPSASASLHAAAEEVGMRG
jgi:glutathione S-transferase